MSITTTAHLNFRGLAQQALEFYQSVFGGEIALVTHAQTYGTEDPAEADLIGWGQVTSDAGFSIMAFDVPARMDWNPGEIPLFISVRGTDADEIKRYWAGLNQGATILQDLAPAGWSALYGMIRDRFGITWVIDVATAPAA